MTRYLSGHRFPTYDGSVPIQPDTGAAVAGEFERLDSIFESSKHSAAVDGFEAALVGEVDLEAVCHPRNRSVVQWILPSIFMGLWIISRFGRCSGCTSRSVIFTDGLQRLQSN
ncbi:hypothetical protein, partial [Mesorhizobium sp. M0204]